jgi:hypothetical protein
LIKDNYTVLVQHFGLVTARHGKQNIDTSIKKNQDRSSVSGIQANEQNLPVFKRCYSSLILVGVLHRLGSYGLSMYWEISPPGVKQARYEADYSPQHSAKARKGYSYTSSLLYTFMTRTGSTSPSLVVTMDLQLY